jgi:hypothetical protein
MERFNSNLSNSKLPVRIFDTLDSFNVDPFEFAMLRADRGKFDNPDKTGKFDNPDKLDVLKICSETYIDRVITMPTLVLMKNKDGFF